LRAYWKTIVNIWIDVIASIGSKLRASESLAGWSRRGARRAHVMAFPGKPPIRVERIIHERRRLRAVERRLALDVLFLGATDRDQQSRRHTG
jgi:hypothetical protein